MLKAKISNDKQTDQGTDRQTNRRIKGQTDRQTDVSRERQSDERTDHGADRNTNRRIKGQTCRQTDGSRGRHTDKQTDQGADRQTNRRIKGQTDRQTDECFVKKNYCKKIYFHQFIHRFNAESVHSSKQTVRRDCDFWISVSIHLRENTSPISHRHNPSEHGRFWTEFFRVI